MTQLTDREVRLLCYALDFLRSSLDPDLMTEAAQEMAPETQQTGEPLPDVPGAITRLLDKLKTPSVIRA
ncbi:hypothetical protein R5W24_000438 [Gemmata sp. JC717]|uniref:hypothetical protein n=1 Tax=Gemmata algarum TaxID=2975278 RepID=UPI0021BABDD6|nr:hypothetical protein [Gemmata algarum]MDY3551362.1 hypothetical protein [Gemmata algarum]